jgi:hypothetical protein
VLIREIRIENKFYENVSVIFFTFFCNGLTNFTILAKHKNENEYKFRNILQLFLLFLLWTEKGIGIVLCKKVKIKQTIYNPDANRDFFF